MRPTTPAPSLHQSWVVLPTAALAGSIPCLIVARVCSTVEVGFPVSALGVAAQRSRGTQSRDPARAFGV
jgi:hypothetical protein